MNKTPLLSSTTKILWPACESTALILFPDINECITKGHNCSTDARCANTPGGFNCDCDPGFSGDGYICIGMCVYFHVIVSLNWCAGLWFYIRLPVWTWLNLYNTSFNQGWSYNWNQVDDVHVLLISSHRLIVLLTMPSNKNENACK